MMIPRRLGYAVVAVAAAACGDNSPAHDVPYFEWNGQRSVGAMSLDGLDITDDAPLMSKLQRAKDDNSVAMVYGHRPSELVSLDTVETLLLTAQQLELPSYTFADLALDDGVAKAGINLSFDDTEVDDWFSLRDLLAKYHAHATFFVTRYFEFSDDARAKLHILYDDGNSIEAHGVNHVNGPDYVAAHGLDAYIADEVQPSIDVLIADGFTPVAFAHPYGRFTHDIDTALMDHVSLVRSISRTPLPGHDAE